ncbi:RCC1 domain-containing protein [Micromonospora endophytica]|uniref:RCC1-like domain-containing protein n=1 Tax=Micromonospora endophytica TaxID=515350 RepID=A0A2W2D959_9ACTN|nr:hypothetical protein C1I93_12395 [Micromonospora endophytica]RIW51433.1 hypothetical protein D3H59_00785 [Micromonospora endophytica]BCJ62152.1 hypothetical protein Jiend_55740 [Micromonospora endophytica]
MGGCPTTTGSRYADVGIARRYARASVLAALAALATLSIIIAPGGAVAAHPRTVLDRVIATSAGSDHSLALRADGTVVAWGNNTRGQLGDGTTTASGLPVRVCAVGQSAPCTQFLGGVKAITASRWNNTALLGDGTVVAWGYNSGGQLGNGTNTASAIPVRVCAVGQSAPCTQFLGGVKAIAASGGHTLALLTDNTVVGWGESQLGELGGGTISPQNIPIRVCAVGQTAPCTQHLSDVSAIEAGGGFSVALLGNGTVATWGASYYGQLGNGRITLPRQVVPTSVPVQVCAVGQTMPCTHLLSNVSAISAGGSHSMALLDDGTVVAWGANAWGQIGNGATTTSAIPEYVCAVGQTAPCTQPLSNVQRVEAGGHHSTALLRDNKLLSWGGNYSGQLGDGTTTASGLPVRVCAVGQSAPCTRWLTNARVVDAGGQHNTALLRDGTVATWGANTAGMLGHGNPADPFSSTPVRVLPPIP